MKRFLFMVFGISLVLNACGSVQTQVSPIAQNSMLTLSVTKTPIPPTSTVTPLPTIPTFTPTFDVSTIVTVTPAKKSECPANSKIQILEFKSIAEVIEYLNQGGSSNTVLNSLGESASYIEDLTGDGIPEIIIKLNGLGVFSCKDGIYRTLLNIVFPTPEASVHIALIKDINGNNLPEIITQSHGIGTIPIITYHILEWNGDAFKDLIKPMDYRTHYGSIRISTDGYAFTNGVARKNQSIWETWEIQDLEKNGTYELILKAGLHVSTDALINGNWRAESLILMWNGKDYVPQEQNIEDPIYRYQAIQDADYATLDLNYELARNLYQSAISNNSLEWWSLDRALYKAKSLQAQSGFLEAPTSPVMDPTEYPKLAAYAYYRITLLQFAQGQDSEATTTYQTLQDTFGNDAYASPYIEMATAFWEAYQSTHKMYDGCAAAIQYAVEHPEILIPLGSDYHGWQSHTYKPEDVCPFR